MSTSTAAPTAPPAPKRPTGPQSPEARAKVRANALKHGLRAETLVSDQPGLALVGVFPSQQSTQRAEIVLLGLGEIRPASGDATMVALVDMSMNPFGVADGRADRGHFLFSESGQTTNFYGVLNGGELRRTLAWSASS